MAASITVEDTNTQDKFDEVVRKIDVLRTQYPTVVYEPVTQGNAVVSITVKVPEETATQTELLAAYQAA